MEGMFVEIPKKETRFECDQSSLARHNRQRKTTSAYALDVFMRIRKQQ